MPCKDLQPLVQSSDNKKLKYIKFEDVKAVIGEEPYARNEKEMQAQYNSEEVVPQMIFLGIDESVKDGLDYQGKNRYVGAPFFAVDVTPRGNVKEACEELVKRVETGGVQRKCNHDLVPRILAPHHVLVLNKYARAYVMARHLAIQACSIFDTFI
jgi:hypothetical protein